jgi:GT2 family glycosyltransferase
MLTIVIVSYNANRDLERCLDALAASPPLVEHEVVVVDNASNDGSADAVRERPTVRLIEAGSNLGFARANNLAIRATRGELVLLLNSDTVPAPGAIDTLVNRLVARPDAAVIGPRLVDANGRLEVSTGRMIGPFAELWRKILVRMHARGAPGFVWYVERRAHREHAVDWVSGACLLVRRSDAEAVGLLDERFFMYTEDVDFCAAIRARGRKVLFTPAADVVHARGRSAAAAPAATQAAYRRSQIAFYDKHLPTWAPLLRAYLRLRRKIPDNL